MAYRGARGSISSFFSAVICRESRGSRRGGPLVIVFTGGITLDVVVTGAHRRLPRRIFLDGANFTIVDLLGGQNGLRRRRPESAGRVVRHPEKVRSVIAGTT